MDIKEVLKKYWFIGLIALGLLVYLVVYTVSAIEARPTYVDTKTDENGNYIIYTVGDEKLLADDLYETLYEDAGAYRSYLKWSRAVIDKAVKSNDEINELASNYANYINYYNDKETIDSELKSAGYPNGYDDLLEYCTVNLVKADYLYREFYTNNYDTYAGKIIEEYHPKKVYHILVKVENVEETEDEDGNSVFVANMSDEEQQKLNDVLNALDNGEDWAEVCAKYSDDTTAENAGYLGIYDDQTIGQQMVTAFADGVIALDYDQTSDIILSEYGYHIIRVEKPTDEELKADKQFMSEFSSYYSYSNLIAIKEKSDELGFEIIDEKLKAFIEENIENAASEIASEETATESEGEE